MHHKQVQDGECYVYNDLFPTRSTTLEPSGLKTQIHNQRMSQQLQHTIQEIVLPMIQQLQRSFEPTAIQ